MVSKIYLKEVITDLYWKEMKNTYEIAENLGLWQGQIHELMKRLRIPTRSRREARRLWWKKQKEREMMADGINS